MDVHDVKTEEIFLIYFIFKDGAWQSQQAIPQAVSLCARLWASYKQ